MKTRFIIPLLGLLLAAGCGKSIESDPPFWTYVDSWSFEEPSLWNQAGDSLLLESAGHIPDDLRRPGSVAVATGTEALGTFHLRAEVQSTRDTSVVGRDVILVFGYQSPERFYYAHLSNDNTIMPHNGIFLVDRADRRRIDDQGPGDPPEARMDDYRWHDLRLDRDVDSGRIRVFVDDLRRPLMTATDTTLRHGAIGFGSFDDTGIIRSLKWAKGPAPFLDPVVEHPGDARLSIQLESFVQIPASDTTGGPMARINVLVPPGDESGRLFVPDLRGTLHVIHDGNVHPYLEVGQRFTDFVDSPGLGSGLGFVAFHPEFGTNGRFYTVHTEAARALEHQRPDYSSGQDIIQGVLTEWTATDPSATAFEGTQREIVRLGFRAVLHGIQQIDFNPLSGPGDEDYGLLYVAVGDGEAPGAQSRGPQSLSAHNGKILRIDPTGTDSPNGGYGIPSVNPFAGDSNALGEIWAFGFRNPHRFSWDSETGQMFISHIGEARVDAIFRGMEGANYGWNEREGGFRYERQDPLEVYPVLEDQGGFVAPSIVMDHDDMAALVGGFVYRGKWIEALKGTYVFADLASGRLFEARAADMMNDNAAIKKLAILDQEGRATSLAALAGRNRAEIRFGWDSDGEMYILSKANGMIWKVTDAHHVEPKH